MSTVSLLRTAPALIAASGARSVAALTRLLSERLPLQRGALTSDQVLNTGSRHPWFGARAMLDARVRVDDHNQFTTASVRVTTDDQGWRDASCTLGSSRIVAFGDGFAFGLGASDRHMFTRYTGTATKSVGAPGRSMVDTVLQMEEMAQGLSDRTLVWLVYLGNDLTDNLRPFLRGVAVPYVRRRGGSWEVQSAHVEDGAVPLDVQGRDYHTDLAAICSDTPESARALAAADYLIARASRSCEAAGARLVVMTVPRRAQLHRRDRARVHRLSPDQGSFDVRRPDAHLAATCARLGVAFVPLLDHIEARDYQIGDRLHWRRSGHRKVGTLIGRVHRELTGAPPGLGSLVRGGR